MPHTADAAEACLLMRYSYIYEDQPIYNSQINVFQLWGQGEPGGRGLPEHSPSESAKLKNHLKREKRKLAENHLPRVFTCFMACSIQVPQASHQQTRIKKA